MRKIIISLAPVKAGTPIDEATLVTDIVKSIDKGAAICHLHSRDLDGTLVENPEKMMAIFNGVLAQKDIVVQASTGGISTMTIEQRCSPLAFDIVNSCSLNAGSTNLGEDVYINSFADIRYVSQQASKRKIVPEIEVFDIGMIDAMEKILADINLEIPSSYNLVFGHAGGMQATVNNLIAFKSAVPHNRIWGVTHFGRINWDFIACAITMGATVVRIGFEDSNNIDSQTTTTNNYELVERLSHLIKAIGYEVATVEEAKEILNIK